MADAPPLTAEQQQETRTDELAALLAEELDKRSLSLRDARFVPAHVLIEAMEPHSPMRLSAKGLGMLMERISDHAILD